MVSEPGECYLSASGEIGGLWRHAGHPPEDVCGVRFSAEGWGAASAYHRLPDSYAGPAARLFRGIDDRLIGTTGLALGGAAGDEIDRFVDRPDSLDRVYHLAVSQPMSPRYRLVVEDQLVSAPDTRGGRHPDVRADMIYGENDAGGRVFSAGSICFTAALPVDDYDNPVARLAVNVIRDFLA